MKKNILLIVQLISISLVVAILLFSCSPVKQVLKDRGKTQEVFEKGLLSGIISCVTKSDTVFRVGRIDTTFLTNFIPVLDDNEIKHKADSIGKTLIELYKDSSDIDCTKQINDAYDAGYRECRGQLVGKITTSKNPDTFYIRERDVTKENLLKANIEKMNAKLLVSDSTLKDVKHKERHSIKYNLGNLWISLSNHIWFWLVLVTLGGYFTRRLWMKFIPGNGLLSALFGKK